LLSPASQFFGTKRFRLIRRVGAGAMGEVFEAYDCEHDTRVALKLLSALTPGALLLFKNEFRSLHDLQHPNLVSFGELLEDGGRWFFTMEFVDGTDLLAYVRSQQGLADDELPTQVTNGAGDDKDKAEAEPTVKAASSFDEARLRDGLKQLARGLVALHAAGKIHRDIKPSNVRVTSEGRVVLLDFGLVTEAQRGQTSDGEKVMGTPGFMAPEQAINTKVGPEADWYAFGVVLHVCLTGRLPFRGTPMRILREQQLQAARAPSTLVSGLPADLDSLCEALLHTNPMARPTGRDVLQRLGVAGDAQPIKAATPSTPAPDYVPFIGRVAEMALLNELLERAHAGRMTTVFVHGESGVGKTALTLQFTKQAKAGRGALVLAGRCFEEESVPFKGVDGLIDALSQHLMALSESDRLALLPDEAALLTQVFPVLRGVPEIAASPLAVVEIRDPQELRSRAFAAVRELLSRLALRRPLILQIDDAQWSDADSLALLRELARPPEAPALLLILTVRTRENGPLDAPELAVPGAVQHIEMRRLDGAESRELAAQLLAQQEIRDEKLSQAIAAEAQGHPLFIDELARRTQASGAGPGQLLLEDVLWARIAAFGDEARAVLEIASVAGKPVLRDIAARALAMDFGELQKRVAQLRIAHLVRQSESHAGCIELYHDRIRTAVLAHLTSDERCGHHRRLASALETGKNRDLEALALNWRGAGESEKALSYAVQAADQAAGMLAFERAAQLYQMAIELGLPDDEHAHTVYARLGAALKHAGRGGEAGHAYVTAAEKATAQADKLELQRRAAEELLLSGHIDEGMAILRALLTAVGLKLPTSPARTLASLALSRARIRLRGFHFRERAESDVDPEALTRMDVSWSASIGLSVLDHISCAAFQCGYMLQALRTGEPRRIARSICIEAGMSSTGGSSTAARTRRLLDESEQLASRLGDPFLLGWHKVVEGMAEMMAGRWRRALQLSDQGAAMLRSRCTGVAWEIGTAQLFATDSLWSLGELREFARRVPLRIAESRARGDRYAAVSFRTGLCNACWLLEDDVAAARTQVDEAAADWSHGVEYHHLHWRVTIARVHIDLYLQDGASAHARILERWPGLKRAQLQRIELAYAQMLDMRARTAIATAAAQPDKRALLKSAQWDVRALNRKLAWVAPGAHLLQAGIAALEGNAEAASRQLRQAAQGFDAADMVGYAVAARRQLGRVLGGDEGARLVVEADQWMSDQGVKNPERLVQMIAPGFV
jgi:serine/threonine protein kinase